MIPGRNTLVIRIDGREEILPSPIIIKSGKPVRLKPGGGNARFFLTPIFIRNTGKQLVVTARVEFEAYIAGVVSGEMPGGEGAALQAQAVAARSYSVKNRHRHKKDGFDFCDSTHCQFYRGHVSKGSRFHHAAMSTKGEVLFLEGRIVEALYHSACGGRTSNPVDVLGRDIPGLISVEDRLKGEKKFLCSRSPHFRWKKKVLKNDVQKILKREPSYNSIDCVEKIVILKKDRAGRAVLMKISGKKKSFRISGYDFWQMIGSHLGWGRIKSSFFSIDDRGEYIIFYGRGLGHGLGMCQWGAMEMEKRGYGYKRILKHYFPGVEIVRMY